MIKNAGNILLRWELSKSFQSILNSFLDFLFPPFCHICKEKMGNSKIVCEDCLSKIQHATSERIETEFNRKFRDAKIISEFCSLFVFEKDKEFQTLIHTLKYDGKLYVGKFLGQLIAVELKEKLQSWNCDIIIPVPLHPVKRAERGYNQSDFIAKGISSILKIPVSTKILKRKRFTQSQTTMTLTERKENIEGAFSLRNGVSVTGKKIILLDDVITTGATISECGRVLLNAGAEKVFALSAAIAD